MTKARPGFVNIGGEREVWVPEELIIGSSQQDPEQHRWGQIASGSTTETVADRQQMEAFLAEQKKAKKL